MTRSSNLPAITFGLVGPSVDLRSAGHEPGAVNGLICPGELRASVELVYAGTRGAVLHIRRQDARLEDNVPGAREQFDSPLHQGVPVRACDIRDSALEDKRREAQVFGAGCYRRIGIAPNHVDCHPQQVIPRLPHWGLIQHPGILND